LEWTYTDKELTYNAAISLMKKRKEEDEDEDEDEGGYFGPFLFNWNN